MRGNVWVRLYNPVEGAKEGDDRMRDGGTWGPFESIRVSDARIVVDRHPSRKEGVFGIADGLGCNDRPTYELAHRANDGTWLENWPSGHFYAELYLFGGY